MNYFKFLGIELVNVSVVEKLIATLAGAISMLLLTVICLWTLPAVEAGPVIASMGASAVLLFAVPHGPLSQPWPVIAGHGLSAVIGVACANLIPQPHCAAACAVGLAIGAMYHCKCIHPPGGATAYTAVMGGAAVKQLGFGFVLFPVLANAIIMVGLAVAINYAFKWRRYPASLQAPAHPVRPVSPGYAPPTHEEVLAAVRSLDAFVDISEQDLLLLTELLAKGAPGKEQAKADVP